ncbi:DUF4625 domain-containing protein [Plebeiibacterium sediminum]|uniref:DUF4625 domain-containing protein n=1 Tax=Plebeiibacterium sediminum TaxID=2992112 RepID=A0AAE3M167_9BACT|nr:DUF4625 domain-containing protein [Plebeiobacterium sediminum]MCW3785213.1 DUF4625 domain-containing protein [Plebeiobacterium sediminum]
MKIYFPKMISFLFVGMVILSSCGGDKKDDPPVDTTSPTIQTTVPAANQSYSLGGSFHYTGTFTDDIELKQVTFSVSKISAPAVTGIDDPLWSPEVVTFPLTGTSEQIDEAIYTIPAGVNDGVYQLTIVCTDASDNSATENITVNLGSTNY